MLKSFFFVEIIQHIEFAVETCLYRIRGQYTGLCIEYGKSQRYRRQENAAVQLWNMRQEYGIVIRENQATAMCYQQADRLPGYAS